MHNQTLQFVLIAMLALALCHAAYTDWRERVIENWLNAGIALSAPLFWWASGLSLWPGVGIQLGFAVFIFLLFLIPWILRGMGGGDVKLIAALALWIPPIPFVSFLVAMSLLGLVLTFGMIIRHKWQKALGRPEIPYGIAISLAGLWSIYERYLNHFA